MLEAGASRAPLFDNRQERTGAVRKRRHGGLTRPSRPGERSRGARLLVLVAASAAIIVAIGLAFFLQQQPALRPGKIVVTVSPPTEAELFVDGRSSGKIPPHLRSVAAGDHRIEIKAAGYRVFATTVSVRSGARPVEIDAALEADAAAPAEGAELHGSSAPR
jgi:hypothetical protein